MTVMNDFREYLLPATYQASDGTDVFGTVLGPKQPLSVLLVS